jgi:hypothetical protein
MNVDEHVREAHYTCHTLSSAEALVKQLTPAHLPTYVPPS